jgi:hypothetical protein
MKLIYFSFPIFFFLLFKQKPKQPYQSIPGTVLFDKQTFHWDGYKNKKNAKWTVTPFRISKYVESNFQYRAYLDFLVKNKKEAIYQNALPNPEIWEQMELSTMEADYFKEHYWQDENFDNYPVLGLNGRQIIEYMQWKSNKINEARLWSLNMIPSEMALCDTFHNSDYYKTHAKHMIPSYYLPSYAKAICAFRKPAVVYRKQKEQFSKWLYEHERYHFLLSDVPKKYKTPHKTDDLLEEKLTNMGIIPVFETDFQSIRENKDGYKLYELTYEGDFNEQEPFLINGLLKYYSNINLETLKAQKYIFENKELKETEQILVGNHPLITFRTFSWVHTKNK